MTKRGISMNDYIILVNEQDETIGYSEKMDAHKNGKLHRAFSIFIFDWNTKKMLIQKRAFEKYHSGGLWTNACCSHPLKDETMVGCLNTRLAEELGLCTDFNIKVPSDCGLLLHGEDVIYSCGKFSYFASFGEVVENEIDHVFLYSPVKSKIDLTDISFNKQEIEEIKWISIEELKSWMESNPKDFTAWFKSAFELAYIVFCRQAGNIDMFFDNDEYR